MPVPGREICAFSTRGNGGNSKHFPQTCTQYHHDENELRRFQIRATEMPTCLTATFTTIVWSVKQAVHGTWNAILVKITSNRICIISPTILSVKETKLYLMRRKILHQHNWRSSGFSCNGTERNSTENSKRRRPLKGLCWKRRILLYRLGSE